jgi:hypothetical protein
MTVSLILFLGLTGNSQTGNVFLNPAFADSSTSSEISMDDELEEFWQHFNIEEEDEDDEEESAEESEEEEEENQGDEESEDEDDDEESSFLDFLSSEDSDNQDDEEEDNSSSTDDESTDWETSEDFDTELLMVDETVNWDDVPGVKVPFFFLMDSETRGINDAFEPAVARFKALKLADQMTNGISFKYETTTQSVYLAENMVEIPEFVHIVDRMEFVGVSRFEYEVAIPEEMIESKTNGRRVVGVGEKRSKTVALSFEAARKEAFTQAVISAFLKERFKKDPQKTTYTGTITGWEVLSEGWKQENDAFYMRLRAWIEFDR